MARETLRGIEGLRGREPVGAILRIGRKKPGKGQYRPPVETDRFTICMPTLDANQDRPLHPGFRFFNEAPAAQRMTIRAVLVHASEQAAFHYNLLNYKQPKREGVSLPQIPNRRPFCVGDGVEATRWDADKKDFVRIVCPHDRCQFRVGTSPTCKPHMRVYFQPVWHKPHLPRPLMCFESKAWSTSARWRGFFDHIAVQAAQLGLRRARYRLVKGAPTLVEPSELNLYGFPLTITLGRRADPEKQQAFPIVIPSPSTNLQDFIADQINTRHAIERRPRFAALDESEEHEPTRIHESHVALEAAPAADADGKA